MNFENINLLEHFDIQVESVVAYLKSGHKAFGIEVSGFQSCHIWHETLILIASTKELFNYFKLPTNLYRADQRLTS